VVKLPQYSILKLHYDKRLEELKHAEITDIMERTEALTEKPGYPLKKKK
jgi:hypothetical protein